MSISLTSRSSTRCENFPVSELIGFDYAERDWANGKGGSESTNYLTGVRKTNGKASTVPKTKVFIDDVDYEKLEEGAVNRLGLGQVIRKIV